MSASFCEVIDLSSDDENGPSVISHRKRLKLSRESNDDVELIEIESDDKANSHSDEDVMTVKSPDPDDDLHLFEELEADNDTINSDITYCGNVSGDEIIEISQECDGEDVGNKAVETESKTDKVQPKLVDKEDKNDEAEKTNLKAEKTNVKENRKSVLVGKEFKCDEIGNQNDLLKELDKEINGNGVSEKVELVETKLKEDPTSSVNQDPKIVKSPKRKRKQSTLLENSKLEEDAKDNVPPESSCKENGLAKDGDASAKCDEMEIENELLEKLDHEINGGGDEDLEYENMDVVEDSINEREETEDSKKIYSYLLKFLDKCYPNIVNTEYESMCKNKGDYLKKLHKQLSTCEWIDWDEIETLLASNLEKIEYTAKSTIINMSQVYNAYKYLFQTYLTTVDPSKLTPSEKKWVDRVKSLESLAEKCLEKIKELETQEVDWEEEEEDSPYIQVEAYKTRYMEIYKKLCALYQEDGKVGSSLFKNLHVNDARSDILNSAINVKFRKYRDSPDFLQFNKFAREVVAKRELAYEEELLTSDIKACFKSLCKAMAKRRRRDLYDVHKEYIEMDPDFNVDDENVKAKVEEHERVAKDKFEKIIKKYVDIQEGLEKNGKSNDDAKDMNDSEVETDIDMSSSSSSSS